MCTVRLKIAICEDELSQSAWLAETVSLWAKTGFHMADIRVYADGESFLYDFEEEKDFHLLLLDIELSGMSGVDLAKHLRRENSRAEILFLTSHTEFYGEGYEVDALHYLIKPVKQEKLFSVLDKAAGKLAVEPSYIIVSCEGQTIKLYESEICYVEAFLHYVSFVTRDGSYRVREKISDIEKRLSDIFFRVHRSYLVSLRYIRMISRSEVLLWNDVHIPLARGKYDAINRAYINVC